MGAGSFGSAFNSACSATPAGGALFTISCSGEPLIRTPKWTGQASYEHEFTFGTGATLTPSGRVSFATKRYLDANYGPVGLAPSYGMLDASLTYTTPNKKISFSGFFNNITNATNYTAGSAVRTSLPNGSRYYTATIDPPRNFGVRARVNF